MKKSTDEVLYPNGSFTDLQSNVLVWFVALCGDKKQRGHLAKNFILR